MFLTNKSLKIWNNLKTFWNQFENKNGKTYNAYFQKFLLVFLLTNSDLFNAIGNRNVQRHKYDLNNLQ